MEKREVRVFEEEDTMAYKIGFIKEDYERKVVEEKREIVKEEIVPRKSVVQVFFSDRGRRFAYYNDQFDLQCGDIVYVDGKLVGQRGRVAEVNYNFKIKLSYYKRVIAVADTNVKGEFHIAGTHFVTFDAGVLPSEKVLTWFKAPMQEEEYASGGDGTSISIDQLSDLNVGDTIAQKGFEYYAENKVRYICVDGSHGYALVEGSEVYEVEFEYRDREISNLVCSCFCSYHCKHEVAALLQLRDTLDYIEKYYKDEYERTGYFAAIGKGTLFQYVIDRRESGRFVL